MTAPSEALLSQRIRREIYGWASLGQTRRVALFTAELRTRGWRPCTACHQWHRAPCKCREKEKA